MVEGSDVDAWLVLPNTKHHEYNKDPRLRHRRNKIKTTKYTIFTFLPKNLFEQFHRFANIYFLFIVVLNWIPAINAFGKEIAMFPLIFVLAVTAIKDLVEDRQRYNSDRIVNNKIGSVYDSTGEKYVDKKWEDIVVGDVIRLYNNDILPADMLLLNSSDDSGVCHVSTANLDGENNLKQKQLPKGFLEVEGTFQEKDIKYKLQCEKPNNQLHSFFGHIDYPNGEKTAVDKNNLLLRGCVLKNTNSVVGLVVYAGHETKAMLNNSGPRYKRSRLEKDINKDIVGCVLILLILCLAGALGTASWTSDFVNYEKLFTQYEAESSAYEGFLRFLTFIIVLQVIIPISLYVSVEIVKLGQVYFINQDLHLFYEKTAQYPVCRATNINEDLGQIQYVFSDKTGTLTENKMVFKKCSVRGKSLSHPEASTEEETSDMCQRALLEYSQKYGTADFMNDWDEFCTVLTICNTVVVSSQPEVTNGTVEEMLYDNSCNDTFDDEQLSVPNGFKRNSMPDLNRSTSSNRENRSRSEAPNIMIHTSSPTKQPDGMMLNDEVDFLAPGDQRRVRMYSKHRSDRLSRSIESINSWLDFNLVPVYEYESPDEGALVKAATCYGYKLANRTPDKIFFATPMDELKIYDILQVLSFDSARKRMSIIVRDDKGKIIVYTKGADTAIMNRLRDDEDETVTTNTDEQLEKFATQGLRTLCIAKRELSESEYDEWLENHKKAETALDGDREEKLAESADTIERNFHLLGATGIEDRLQDGVPETIASLRHAGIKLWILTGDKQETAVNIGFSCKLLDPSMEIITINSSSKEQCAELLQQIKTRINSRWPSYTVLPSRRYNADTNNRPPLALIIDGISLSYTLQAPLDKQFVEIANLCESVICCRAAPLQKAAVVRLVRDNLKVMTLAIGDGANDVSMLQTAEIGIGIAGEEGVQAVMASDFVIGRFSFLKRLLLLHGFWCYERISRMILYFFYKNAMFVALLFWYQIYNGFSGSNAIDDVSLILFNLIFTSLPPIFNGIFDQCLPENVVLSRPILYQLGQLGKLYTRRSFWISILDAFYQSLVLFFIPYFTYVELPAAGMIVIGILFHQLAVVTANVHIGIETPNWTVIHAVVIIGSVILSFLYYFIYCSVIPLHLYSAIFKVMSQVEFWFLLLICPFLALLPRIVLRILQISFFPNVLQTVKSHRNNTNNAQLPRDTENNMHNFSNDVIYRPEEMSVHRSTPT